MPENAYILHTFSRYQRGKCCMYIIGRLQNGETFGFIDKSFAPCFYIRHSDSENAREILRKQSLYLKESTKKAMDDEDLLLIRHADIYRLKKAAAALAKKSIRTYESDVKVEQQYLMDKRLRSTCQIDGPWRPGEAVQRIYENVSLTPVDCHVDLKSIVLETFFENEKLRAFALCSHADNPKIVAEGSEVEDEKKLILKLQMHIKEIDADIICGWRVQDDNFLLLKQRFAAYALPFDLGRSRKGQWFVERLFRGRELSVLQGRQLLDIESLMSHTWERYAESTPESIIKAVFDEDVPEKSAENCGARVMLLTRLLKKKNLVDLSLRRSLLTGLSLERCWGSIAAFEYLYMLELHKQNFAAPDLGVDRYLRGGAPGGLVMEPHAGIHKNIFVFDFKSLYPSIIRTFNIDPLAYARALKLASFGDESQLLELPNGVKLDRRAAILPETLKRFFASREAAKKDGDELASFVCKILMNSFFGVLGTPGCRFAQGALVSGVSQTGHYLLRWTRKLLEGEGYKVLYGDTDSLFVDLGVEDDLTYEQGQKQGIELQTFLNASLREHLRREFSLDSCLDLEFEKLYPAFFQPSMRGDDKRGRAKSYAALKSTKNGNELEIIGLEAVRRDWTTLAQTLQRELLLMIFGGVEGQKIEEHVQGKIRQVKGGVFDDELIYRKSLSKGLDSYTSTTPPHVKAARLLDKVPRVIFYVMTKNGPQPISMQKSGLDYQHYIDKQIEPIVRTLSLHYDFDWQKAVLSQQSLF
ncbi:MAG: hypothetical protein HRT88_02920 [Lentisphaeraceae bacterium]|nr:hypothetical protein [Lentisphaeraceae bacterium]